MKIVSQQEHFTPLDVDFSNAKGMDPLGISLLSKLFVAYPDLTGFGDGTYSVSHEGSDYTLSLTDEKIIRVPRDLPHEGYRYYLKSNQILGEGSFGSVYTAFKLKQDFDKNLTVGEREYAVKVANPSSAFGREAEIIQKIPGYRGKPPVIFEDRGYQVMAKFDNRLVLNLEDAFLYIATSLKSLNTLHKAHVAHMDMKIPNLLFDGREARFIDFNCSLTTICEIHGTIRHRIKLNQLDIADWRQNIAERILKRELFRSQLPKEIQEQILAEFGTFFEQPFVVKLARDNFFDASSQGIPGYSDERAIEEYYSLLKTARASLESLIGSWRKMVTQNLAGQMPGSSEERYD